MPQKKESVFVTVLLILLIIALIGVMFFALYKAGVPLPFTENAKKNEFEKALNENNYQAAYTVYASSDDTAQEVAVLDAHLNAYFDACFSNEYDDTVWAKYRGIEVFNSLISEKVYFKLDETVRRYYNGEFSEDDVKVYLSRLAKFSFAKEKLSDCVDEVKNKNASDKAYEEGVRLFTEGNYADAVKEFKKVSTQDSGRYPYALEGIERSKQEWGSVKLQEAQKMISVYNNEGARALLEELIEIFGEYEEAENLLKTLEPKLEV